MSVVVPCRNEEGNVPELLGSLQRSLRSADQVIVVDDNSIDATSRVAEECGATVIHVGLLPDGWAGKP
ncbi:MAG: glycosyltransferase, partial [Ilumatobacteraceae bacterium]